jgi:hypothetical protein
MDRNPSIPANDTEPSSGVQPSASDDGWEIISRYTRAQAIEDGVLIDVTETPERKEAGIKYPVAITAAAYHQCVALTPAAARAGNDVKGRLWDVLYMMRYPVREIDPSTRIFELLCVVDDVHPTRVQLKAVCGPGDDAEPVITVMLPDED